MQRVQTAIEGLEFASTMFARPESVRRRADLEATRRKLVDAQRKAALLTDRQARAIWRDIAAKLEQIVNNAR